MNRYASGYTLVSLISGIGWLAIALSVVGGIIIGANAPIGFGYIGFTIAIAGSFQGLLLLGVGAIGAAILDGSVAQQDSLSAIRDLANSLRSKSDYKPDTPDKTEYRMRPLPPDFSKVTPMTAIDDILRSDERLR